MKSRDNYRDFRNDYIKKFSSLWDFSVRKKISMFRRNVSIWINWILDQNKNLSKEDFVFLKMRNYDLEIFRDILWILKERNTSKNNWENVNFEVSLEKLIWELHYISYQINTQKLDSHNVFLLLVNEFDIFLKSVGLNISKSIPSQQKTCEKTLSWRLHSLPTIW